jgi:hypothetical protein
MSAVFEFPPNESLMMRVSFESRKGTNLMFSANALITIPRHVNERLIFWASFSTFPSALVFDIFSEPAKSIRNSLLTFACAVYE